MTSRPCSKSEEKQLRDMLAEHGMVDDAMQPVWNRVLVTYQEEVMQVEQLCLGLDRVEGVTSRVKTIPTLVEKLRRFPTQQLFNIDDLAGCRVLAEDVVHQHQLLTQLSELLVARDFTVKAIKDRRWHGHGAGPSHGYRAVHVIARKGWLHCEIQLRTRLQQQWAELFESVCDSWGRGPRYGEPLENGNLPASSTTAMTRGQFIDLLTQVSSSIEALELASLRGGQAQLALEAAHLSIRSLRGSITYQEAQFMGPLTPEEAAQTQDNIAIMQGGLKQALSMDAASQTTHDLTRTRLAEEHQRLRATLAELRDVLEQERPQP